MALSQQEELDGFVSQAAAQLGVDPAALREECQAVLHSLPPYAPDGPLARDDQLQEVRDTFCTYVWPLKHPEHGQHQAAYDALMDMIQQKVKTTIYMLSDRSLELTDFYQEVLIEVFSSLDSFSYRSQFKTWVGAVAARTIARVLRTARAKKRSAHLVALDLPEAQALPDDSSPRVEDQAVIQDMIGYIKMRLRTTADQRLLIVFEKWYEDDLALYQIAALLKLSQPRVSGLRQQLLKLLKADQHIVQWFDTMLP